MSPRGQRKTDTSLPKAPKRSLLQRFLRGFALIIDLVAVAALLVSGYAGCVSPLSHSSWWGAFPLAFPICFWVVIVLLLMQLLWHRRGALLLALGLVACGGPVLTYFPLHILSPEAPDGAERFSLMTYNTYSRALVKNKDTGLAEFILKENADIVCTQEAFRLAQPRRSAEAQRCADSLKARYPHIVFGGRTGTQAILSKYPVENIHLDVKVRNFPSGDVAAYRVTLPSGRKIAVFNVHLYSFGLSNTPLREAAENVREGRIVFNKLRTAAEGRAREVNKLIQWLRLYGGPDVIICGDFNDVQGSHAIRTFADVGFRSVYPEIGFGPINTYNARYLYFCIDHVLYRGDLEPLSIRKGRLKNSDHYPLTVDFALNER